MEKSKNFTDKERYEIVKEEINHFKKLIKGNEKLIEAIGKL